MKHNPFMPIRPTKLKDDQPLDYRTHIDHPRSTYNLYDPANMKAQVVLYHWCRSVDFISFVSIGQLHDWLFHKYSDVTSRQMGRTVILATTYDPRKLKAKTLNNPKAMMCYIWKYREEFQYGLEWMLSMWIWRLEHEWKDIREKDIRKITLDILDDLAACDAADMHSLYAIETDNKTTFPLGERIDWQAHWDKYGLVSERPTWSVPMERPPRPIDLSLK
jgi:hypothetical protein